MESATEASSESSAADQRARLGALVAVTVALLGHLPRRLQGEGRQHRAGDAAGPGGPAQSLEFLPGAEHPGGGRRGRRSQFQLASSEAPAQQQAGYRKAIIPYEALVTDQAAKKEEATRPGRAGSGTYDGLNYRDDQFDLADTLIALAISLLALTALTHKPWLYVIALVPTTGGVLMGLAGLLGWHIHPDMIARLLS